MTTKPAPTGSDKDRLEGEGSYSGTRAYNKATKEFIDTGKVDKAARDARRALDSDEASELAAAEARGKAGDPKGQRKRPK
ncbi:MAG: hypothetical protein ABI399_10805 [Bauldia sp.]